MLWTVRKYTTTIKLTLLIGERAYDFLKADGVERIIFAFRHYNPKFRPFIASYLNQVFLNGRKYLEIQKLINYTQCEHDVIKECVMKVTKQYYHDD
jgi:hypothetical protein